MGRIRSSLLLPLAVHARLRLSRAKHKGALIAAGVYWASVPVSYAIPLLIMRDRLGVAFLPFYCLAAPWSFLITPVVEQLFTTPWLVMSGFAILCVLLAGVNAAILYWLVVGTSRLGARMMGRGSG
jgi:hypothetical protein